MKLKAFIRQVASRRGREEVIIDLFNLDGSEYEGGGGGGQLDYRNATGMSFATSGTGGHVEPLDPTVSNLIVAHFNMGAAPVSASVGFLFDPEDPESADEIGVVQFDNGDGLVSSSFEVPPGYTYSIIADGVISQVQFVAEVPRSG